MRTAYSGMSLLLYTDTNLRECVCVCVSYQAQVLSIDVEAS